MTDEAKIAEAGRAGEVDKSGIARAVIEIPGVDKPLQLVGVDAAPVISFDLVPTSNTPYGQVCVTLVALTNYPLPNGGVDIVGRVTGVLRTTPVGAADLINMLQGALLKLAPAANADGPKN